MLIKIWGARGSIPVSGKDYIKYGGNTTCIEIRTKNNKVIIIDAGSGIRELGNSLFSEGKNDYNLIFTHSHWDHILGFPFCKPIYFKRTKIQMYGCPFAQKSVKKIISGVMKHPNFPVDFSNVAAKITFNEVCRKEFDIDTMHITPILLSHPNQGFGYKFEENGKTFVFMTDNELTYKHPGGLEYKEYLKYSEGADLLIHDAEYTEEEYKKTKTWGHTVYTEALKFAIEAGAKQLGLFHHNPERKDVSVDEFVTYCRKTSSESGSSLKIFAAAQNMEIEL